MDKVNVICMKWGNLYDASYVNKLFHMVERNLTLPFNFVCFTDNSNSIIPQVITKPLPEVNVPIKNQVSPWRKLGAYQKDLADLRGKTLFLDLDNIIIDNIDCFFNYSEKYAVAENWSQKGQGVGNTTAFVYEIGKYNYLLENFNNDPDKYVNTYDNEQIYSSKTLGDEMVYFPDSWIKSFKRHCVRGRFLKFFLEPQIPANVKIIAFHGHPRPHEALMGSWPGKLIPYFKRPTWLEKYWK